MKKIFHRRPAPEHTGEATCEPNAFVEAMMAESPSRIGPLCLCMLYGLRLMETLSLLWQDIDFDNEVIHIRRTMLSRNNREIVIYPDDGVRSIPLSAKLKEVLLKLKSRSTPPPDTPVFARDCHLLRETTVHRQLRRLTESTPYAGLRFYDLRRAFLDDQDPRDFPSTTCDTAWQEG